VAIVPFDRNNRTVSRVLDLQEPKKRDQAAHACGALCRARIAEELQRRRGTRIGEHLKLVLSIIDRQALTSAVRPPACMSGGGTW
jgi:hypothetical protein